MRRVIVVDEHNKDFLKRPVKKEDHEDDNYLCKTTRGALDPSVDPVRFKMCIRVKCILLVCLSAKFNKPKNICLGVWTLGKCT